MSKFNVGLNISIGCIFVVFGYLQINDRSQYGNSDWWIWLCLYWAAGIMSIAIIKYKRVKQYINWFCGLFWGCLLFKLQDQQGNLQPQQLNPMKIFDELTGAMLQQSNESLGLLLVCLWFSFLAFKQTSLDPR
ncbi:transmembrane 220 family protein [Catenovulum maritimum]|uniref:Transmembrane protein n=1 Tax=Catenovulum maritimum TaxID=1513271 RepID=A0A0J8GXV2_9ALTE|nr:transmembrane 220 family protein [Catenovulum maritimum]KMT65553.1 hypothetical protein XM47_07545 [Catenovulum maritimum]